ncbi:MAG: hypothetical protein K2X45_08640 [Phreatobacter sp.]|nr:hypothetical protein [Phreatobacter sp.]
MYRDLAIARNFWRSARLMLVALVVVAMSGSLLHAHSSHACRAFGDGLGVGDTAIDQTHRDGRTQDAPDPSNRGLDCCVHHNPTVSASSATPVIDRYRFTSRLVIPDDLVIGSWTTSRLERPPRGLLST